ncbi:MAG: hypothetical protein KC619_16860 [Myxococcales bacterium]|nr:hypothetical protein [Myxococcales bacterium]
MPRNSAKLIEAILSLSDSDSESIEELARELERVHQHRHVVDELGLLPERSRARELRKLVYEGARIEVAHAQDRWRLARKLSGLVEDGARARVRAALPRQHVEEEAVAAPGADVEVSFVLKNSGTLRESVELGPVEIRGTSGTESGERTTKYQIDGQSHEAHPGRPSPRIVIEPSSWVPVRLALSAPNAPGHYFGRVTFDARPPVELWIELLVKG